MSFLLSFLSKVLINSALSCFFMTNQYMVVIRIEDTKEIFMSKKTFYLMRHGETLFNSLGKIQGASDSPLTDLGIKQAEIARKYFEEQNVTLDSAFCSTQERASDTLELVTDLPYKRLKGIKEWNFGSYEGYPSHLVPREQINDYFVKFGGESVDDVINRVQNTVHSIVEDEDNGETILTVAHGLVLKVFYELWKEHNQVTEEYVGPFPNCVILKYEYEDEKFSLIEIIEHDFTSI